MSKNARQQHQNNQHKKEEKTAEQLHNEAVEKLNAVPSKEGIETPDFVKEAEVAQEDAQEEKVDVKVEVDTLPTHVEQAKQKEAPSNRVDIEKLRSRLSTSGNLCLDVFLKYMSDMAPNKPVNEQTGAKYQATFYSALDTMFNRLDDQDFNELYRALLLMFEEHKDGVFSDERVYRFVEHWPLTEAQNAAMKRLLNLMLVTRNPATRHISIKDLKNWDYILEFGLTDRGRNRIRNFYDL